MKHYIYTRVSTEDQTGDNQIHHLLKLYPDAEVISETVSGAARVKPVLDMLITKLQSGDTLIIAALDRLGRRLKDTITLVEDLYSRGIKIVSVRENLDYTTSAGKAMGQMMLLMAELERNLISERTKKSLQRLKAEGRKLGPPRRYTEEQVNQVKVLRSQGLTVRVIAKQVGLSRSYVGKIIKAA